MDAIEVFAQIVLSRARTATYAQADDRRIRELRVMMSAAVAHDT